MKLRSLNRKLTVVTAVMTAVLAALLVFQQTPSQHYRARLSLGQRFLTEGSYEKAEAAFQEAIRIDSKKPEPYIGLGSAYAGQADAILSRYQSGQQPSDNSEQLSMSVKEKEEIEELYKKSREALKEASEIDGGSADAEQVLAYVEEQQEKAEALWGNNDPDPTPEPDPENQVDLSGGSSTALEENTVYGSVDLDGDGSKDTIEISVSKESEGNETSSRILINGQTVLDNASYLHESGGIIKTEAIVLQMNTGDTFLVSFLDAADDDDMYREAIYRYRNGNLEQVLDLTPVDDSGFSYHDHVDDITVKGNTIQFTVRMMPSATGVIMMSRSAICRDHTFAFLSHEAEVISYPYYASDGGEQNPEYYPAKADIPCYETGNSGDIALTVEAGTMCRVTKAYFGEGMHLRRFFLETEDGRSGWFEQSLFTKGQYGSKETLFYGHNFAG